MRFNDGKALGGMECVCSDLHECNRRIDWNVQQLGPAVGVSSPGMEKGESLQKGKRLTNIGSSVGTVKGKNEWGQYYQSYYQ